LPTVIELGIMVSDRMLAPLPPDTPPVDPATVRLALKLTGPAYHCALAVIVVVPALTAVTSPEAFTVATAGVPEVHVTELVMSCVEGWLAFPNVPVAFNCAVCPTVSV
jgi:hypothetical protein